ARGITHRDIKPSNILVTGAGRPLVADFGLSVSGFGSSAPGAEGGTARSGVAGTPAYMSPEQARAEGATPLSDVFSLGATLRALLTGKPPHEADPERSESARDQIMALARAGAIQPLREVRPDLPRTLCAICERATA